MESPRAIQPSVLFLTVISFFACSLVAGCYPMLISTATINVDNDDDDKSETVEKGDSGDQKWGAGKHSNETEILKDWEKPVFTLLVTGRQFGYIEPCGCTGLFNQKGGLMRRHRVQQLLLKRGWNIVPIDAGNQIRRFGQQPVIKLHHTYDGLCNVMKYAAIGFGPEDLKIPTIDLVQTMSNIGDFGPFVSANVDLMGAGLQKQFIVVTENGKKIGITHALDDESIAPLKGNTELEFKPFAQSLNQAAKGMQMAGCDFKVLMLRTEKVDFAKQVANQFPFFDLLIHTTSAGEPEKLPTIIRTGQHSTSLIQVGRKGMYVGAVGYFENAGGKSVKYERIPLDGRFTDSKPMEKVFENYQKQLKTLYESGNLVDVKPRPHPSGSKYMGSEACFDCHQDEFEIWEDGVDGRGGPHFVATDSIVTPPNHRGHIARDKDPECISCHAVGWHPQDFYPYETGFINTKKDELLHGNGCENCHGPGSGHVALREAEAKGKKFPKDVLQADLKSVRLTLKQAENEHCGQCHDADNSPDFLKEGAFKKYWAKIKH